MLHTPGSSGNSRNSRFTHSSEHVRKVSSETPISRLSVRIISEISGYSITSHFPPHVHRIYDERLYFIMVDVEFPEIQEISEIFDFSERGRKYQAKQLFLEYLLYE